MQKGMLKWHIHKINPGLLCFCHEIEGDISKYQTFWDSFSALGQNNIEARWFIIKLISCSPALFCKVLITFPYNSKHW